MGLIILYNIEQCDGKRRTKVSVNGAAEITKILRVRLDSTHVELELVHYV